MARPRRVSQKPYRKSRRVSRKSRRVSRKSRRVSRKSRRVSRKSRRVSRKSRRVSRKRKSVGKRERSCKDLLKEKVGINMGEYEDGRFVSRKQAIAVSYSQVKKINPSCGKYFTRK